MKNCDCVPIDSSTHYPAALSNSNPNACVPSREAVCTIFMMVFGMTRAGRQPTTYRVTGGHAYYGTKSTQCSLTLLCSVGAFIQKDDIKLVNSIPQNMNGNIVN